MEQPDYTRPDVAERTDTASDITTGDTGRLEAFSDGVFAIAITLLVLNLRVPDPNTLQRQSLAGALGQQWPTYAAYLISFAFILIMWVNHHRMFKYIARADHNLLIFNGVLLLFVTVVPFPTSLLSEYLGNSQARRADQVTAAVVYQGTYVLLALAFNLVWFWAARGRRLLDGRLHPSFADTVSKRFRWGPVSYLVCVALAFWSPYASLLLNAALAIFWAWPSGAPRPQRRVSEAM